MFSVGKINIDKAILLAPMESITDVSFRLICKNLGADIVYTEFVNAEGLVRASEKTHKKMKIVESERPIGIQIYGSNNESMGKAALMAEELQPEIIDINAGCWVRNVVGCGAGAGLLKDPAGMQNMAKKVVDAVSIPVTVKTRIGWDSKDINIVEIAKRLEDVGVKAITIHCRTRAQGHSGEVDYSWIPKVKSIVSIPVVVNGGIFSAEDAIKVFEDTGADGVMIARGAIGNPWIFREIKNLFENKINPEISVKEKIETCLEHLRLAIENKGERRGTIEHRKFYSGYLKGLRNSSRIRAELMNKTSYSEVENILQHFAETYSQEEKIFV